MTIISVKQPLELLAILCGLASFIQPKPIVWQDYKPMVDFIASSSASHNISSRIEDTTIDFSTDSSITFARLEMLITDHKDNSVLMSLCYQLHQTFIPPDLMDRFNPIFKSKLDSLLSHYQMAKNEH